MFRRLFFIVIIINIHTSLCSIDDIYEAGRNVWKMYEMIDNWVLGISHDTEPIELDNDSAIQASEKQMDKIHESLNELEKFMSTKKILYAIKSWQLNALIIKDIDTIEIFIQLIDENYEKFNGYRHESYRSDVVFDRLNFEIFQALPGVIEVIRKSAYKDKHNDNDEDVVAAITGFAKSRNAEICGTPQIISDIFMKLLKMLIIAELKTSTMLSYQYLHDCVIKKNQQKCERINSFRGEPLEQQLAIYINIFSSSVVVLERVYQRACDPPDGNWIRDESFYELEKSVEPSLFSYNSYECSVDNCYDMMFRGVNQCNIRFYDKPSGQRPGYAVDECTFLGRMQACLLNSGPYRYQYVKSELLDFFGRNASCPKDNGQLVRTKREPIGQYAACECDVWSSENKINLMQITSDIYSNKVITGLRFVRKYKVLYIQIKEGELGPNGYINESSQNWRPILAGTPFETAPINKENRVFFLDDLILPSGFVLTGVKFSVSERQGIAGFALNILGRPSDYTTGKLSSVGELQWPLESETVAEIPLSFKPVSSIFTRLRHTITQSDGKYVLLKPSRLRDDFGQSTLPLFDAVPIEFSAPSALTGIGIFHKGVEDYAGLISLRVYGIKYSEYFYNFKLSHMFNNRVLFNSSGISSNIDLKID